MGTEILKNLSQALEKQNRTLELYSDILESHTQGEIIQYPFSPFILKGEKIELYLISAIKHVRNI